MPFEILDHTADIQIRVTASELGQIFDQAREALYAVVGELVPEGDAAGNPKVRRIGISGDDLAEVMHDWLAEVLFIFEAERCLCLPDGPYECGERNLRVSVRLLPIDLHASHFDREVKAITYHDLSVQCLESTWTATVIFDI